MTRNLDSRFHGNDRGKGNLEAENILIQRLKLFIENELTTAAKITTMGI
ncbi:MAG: hypothetical protein J7J10_04615 [Deltaproteobacteria bacterium]|nr:hypothetical protein [Deltaproteobacteria bacterium]